MEKESQGRKEGPKADIHMESPWATFKKYRNGKYQAMMTYMDSGLKIHVHPR